MEEFDRWQRRWIMMWLGAIALFVFVIMFQLRELKDLLIRLIAVTALTG